MKVLVCGGRDYGEVPKGAPRDMTHEAHIKAMGQVRLLRDTLDQLWVDRGPFTLIHGACPTGADSYADKWARNSLVPVMAFPAVWYVDGKLDRSAGPRRNGQMIAEGKPDLVVAFPGERGTADMVKRARAAGVEVVEVA